MTNILHASNNKMSENPKKIKPYWTQPSEPIYPNGNVDYISIELMRNYRGPSCNFCRENGEPFQIWSSHYLRDQNGKLQCPILRSHSCEFCGATGDHAHTRSYCPYKHNPLVTDVLGQEHFYNMVDLKRDEYNSAGKPTPSRFRKKK
ncbi:nanos homolog 2 [Dermatophagoides farinae]|uniref:nanos homolog 2 n=1 Tax=Dermatophagoides farinae TaxID=6954 RepID=UPI003F5E366F